jgi:hypothetical protein
MAPRGMFVMEMNERASRVSPTHRFLRRIRSESELRWETRNSTEDVSSEALFASNWRERFAAFTADASTWHASPQ